MQLSLALVRQVKSDSVGKENGNPNGAQDDRGNYSKGSVRVYFQILGNLAKRSSTSNFKTRPAVDEFHQVEHLIRESLLIC